MELLLLPALLGVILLGYSIKGILSRKICKKEGHKFDKRYEWHDAYFHHSKATDRKHMIGYNQFDCKGIISGNRCSRCGFEDEPDQFIVYNSFHVNFDTKRQREYDKKGYLKS